MEITISSDAWLDWSAIAAIGSMLTALLTAVLAGVAFVQLRHLRHSLLNAAEDHDEQLAELREQRGELKEQTEVARETMRNQLRPIVVAMLDSERNVTATQETRLVQSEWVAPFHLAVRNVGSGPAMNALIKFWACDLEAGDIQRGEALLEELGEPQWTTDARYMAAGERALPAIIEGIQPLVVDPKSIFWRSECTDIFGREFHRWGGAGTPPLIAPPEDPSSGP